VFCPSVAFPSHLVAMEAPRNPVLVALSNLLALRLPARNPVVAEPAPRPGPVPRAPMRDTTATRALLAQRPRECGQAAFVVGCVLLFSVAWLFGPLLTQTWANSRPHALILHQAATDAAIDALVGVTNHMDAATLVFANWQLMQEILDTPSDPRGTSWVLHHLASHLEISADILTALGIVGPAEAVQNASRLLDTLNVDRLDAERRGLILTTYRQAFRALDCPETNLLSSDDVLGCLLRFGTARNAREIFLSHTRRIEQAQKRLAELTRLTTSLQLDLYTSALQAQLSWFLPDNIRPAVAPLLSAASHVVFGPALVQALMGTRLIYAHYTAYQEEVLFRTEVPSPLTLKEFFGLLWQGHGLAYLPLLLQLLMLFELSAYLGFVPRAITALVDAPLARYLHCDPETVMAVNARTWIRAFLRGFLDALTWTLRGMYLVFAAWNFCFLAWAVHTDDCTAGTLTTIFWSLNWWPVLGMGLVVLLLVWFTRRAEGALDPGSWSLWTAVSPVWIINLVMFAMNVAASSGFHDFDLPRNGFFQANQGLDEWVHAALIFASFPVDCIFRGVCPWRPNERSF